LQRAGYLCFLREYIELEHMIEMAESEDMKKKFFMSHYVVVKHESLLITKSVFDALAKISTYWHFIK